MSNKVRVYELAKEYGMKGPAFAQFLKELGLESIKSHMAVLDDATELHVRAILEAQGMSVASSAAEPAKTVGLRKKSLPQSDSAAATDIPEGDADELELELESDGDDAGILKKKSLPPPAARSKLRKRLASDDADEGLALEADDATSTASDEAGLRRAPDVPATRESAGEPSTSGSGAPGSGAPGSGAPGSGFTEPASGRAELEPSREPTSTEDVAPAERAPRPLDEESPPHTTLPGGSTGVEARPSAESAERSGAPATPAAAESTSSTAANRDAPPAVDPKSTNVPETSRSAAASTPRSTEGRSATPAPSAGSRARGGAAAQGAEALARDPDAKQPVKRLLVPERRATVIGRIELPQEAISDAKRRSAPNAGGAPGRNPGGVDRNLRQAALRNTQQSRSATRTGGTAGRGGVGAGGPAGARRGPVAGGRGRGMDGRGRKTRGGPGSLSATVDPNKVVEIEPPITVKGLSEALGIRVTDLITALTFKLGVAGKNINSFLLPEEVELVSMEVDRKIKIVERREAEEELIQSIVDAAEGAESLERAPVITLMGHVDHGKTSLLDALRHSDVVRGEAGGITQHVGAYKITHKSGAQFVVLDTPGHEAFTSMRARGAKLTDIVVLVVAADDGVMPQTEEAIAHAKDAKVPVIVAINKSDLPGANAMQVMQQLAVKGLQPEEWGGDVQCVKVSALTGQGLDDLVEQIMLQAHIMELHAKQDAPGEGVVIESKQSPEQGVVVNVLITNGTLRLRDQVLCGESLARVRGIVDDHGNHIKEAGPATPVSLLGMTSLPTPGDRMFVVSDKKKAKEVVDDRQRAARKISLAERSSATKVTVDNLSETLEAAKVDEVKLIIKADVMGSLEPIKNSLERIGTSEVRTHIIHSALGGITESDVVLAQASGAIIVGFNTVADPSTRLTAERAGVELRYYDVIYHLIDDMKLALEGKLKPEEVDDITGHAEIKAVFRSSRTGNIAGLMVTDGIVKRSSRVRLSRDSRVIHTGSVGTLRREKDDVREVRGGYECGLTLKDFNDIKVGDKLEFYDVTYVKRTLS